MCAHIEGMCMQLSCKHTHTTSMHMHASCMHMHTHPKPETQKIRTESKENTTKRRKLTTYNALNKNMK